MSLTVCVFIVVCCTVSCAEESNPVPNLPDDVLVAGMPAGPTDVIPMVRDWCCSN